MRLIRIYQNIPLQENSSVQLDGKAAHHLINVLRIKADAPLIVFNGQGGEFTAVVQVVARKNVSIKIENFINVTRESLFKIHLLQSLVRSEKMDFIMQKACELGVSAITPVITEFCNVKLTADMLEKKHQHWQNILINACEQCERNQLPILHPATKFADVLRLAQEKEKFILHPDNHNSAQKQTFLAATYQPSNGCTILIGPEGGFSKEEVTLAQKNNFKTLSLGPRILRTETAALTAVAILQARYGDLVSGHAPQQSSYT